MFIVDSRVSRAMPVDQRSPGLSRSISTNHSQCSDAGIHRLWARPQRGRAWVVLISAHGASLVAGKMTPAAPPSTGRPDCRAHQQILWRGLTEIHSPVSIPPVHETQAALLRAVG